MFTVFVGKGLHKFGAAMCMCLRIYMYVCTGPAFQAATPRPPPPAGPSWYRPPLSRAVGNNSHKHQHGRGCDPRDGLCFSEDGVVIAVNKPPAAAGIGPFWCHVSP